MHLGHQRAVRSRTARQGKDDAESLVMFPILLVHNKTLLLISASACPPVPLKSTSLCFIRFRQKETLRRPNSYISSSPPFLSACLIIWSKCEQNIAQIDLLSYLNHPLNGCGAELACLGEKGAMGWRRKTEGGEG